MLIHEIYFIDSSHFKVNLKKYVGVGLYTIRAIDIYKGFGVTSTSIFKSTILMFGMVTI